VSARPASDATGAPPAAPAASGSRPPPKRSLPPELLLDNARATAASLLAEVERLRPGLVRHRALDLNCGSGALVQALCERFDECDGLSPRLADVEPAERMNRHGERCRYLHVGESKKLPFANETFDFVYCGMLLPGRENGHAERVIAETIRVLRLLGVAVVDFAGGEDPQGASLPSRTAQDRLEARLSAPERLSLAAGEPGTVVAAVTNTGSTTLGSAINPLRLEAHWNRPPGAASIAAVVELSAVLFPGDSVIVTLPVSVPATPGEHSLELSLASPSPWGERRSPVTIIGIATAPPDSSGDQNLAATAPTGADEPVSMAVTQVDGVILSAQNLKPGPDALPRRRYFFARA
jgi:SAM-dependent methyltransferase